MKVLYKKIEASSLPTVLIISVLIMIIILIALGLWEMNSLYFIRYHFEKQQKMHLSSALSILCNDSLLSKKMIDDKKYQLYEYDVHSLVYSDIYPWGLYECINLYNYDRTIHTVDFVGKSQDCYFSPAIWVCDRNHSISLSGRAEISGNLFLPKNGINYMNSNFDSFKGDLIPEIKIHTSDKDFPSIDSTYIKLMYDLRDNPVPTSQLPLQYNSFSNEVLCATLTNDEEIYAKGKIVLYGDDVTIDSSCKISDIILIARRVTLESGFNGALQIFARDTVEIKNNVNLHYPSGIYINGNPNSAYLHINSNSNIEGYAIVAGNVDNQNGFIVNINYRQEHDSTLSGLLLVDGIAHLEGMITGAAYIKECYYLSGENMYSGLIYNAKIKRSENVAFPFLFKNSKFNKKRIKKVE